MLTNYQFCEKSLYHKTKHFQLLLFLPVYFLLYAFSQYISYFLSLFINITCFFIIIHLKIYIFMLFSVYIIRNRTIISIILPFSFYKCDNLQVIIR